MTHEILELTRPDKVRELQPLVLEYFRIVTDSLAVLGIELAPQDPTDEMMANLDLFVPPKGRCYVAKAGELIVGMTFLKPLPDDEIELKRLYVRPEARGTGLGRRLLRHAMGQARDLGKNRMLLDTISPLKQAIQLYEQHGFKRIEAYAGSEIARYDAIVPHAVFMARKL